MVEIESRLDDVIPERQRDCIGILPTLLVWKRSGIKRGGLAEGDPPSKTDGRRLSMRACERFTRGGHLAELEFAVTAELEAQLINHL